MSNARRHYEECLSGEQSLCSIADLWRSYANEILSPIKWVMGGKLPVQCPISLNVSPALRSRCLRSYRPRETTPPAGPETDPCPIVKADASWQTRETPSPSSFAITQHQRASQKPARRPAPAYPRLSSHDLCLCRDRKYPYRQGTKFVMQDPSDLMHQPAMTQCVRMAALPDPSGLIFVNGAVSE